MVTGDLPTATKAPKLNDKNAALAISTDADLSGKAPSPAGVTKDAIAAYLGYLVARGFMQSPPASSKTLPVRNIPKAQAEALKLVGGRGGGS